MEKTCNDRRKVDVWKRIRDGFTLVILSVVVTTVWDQKANISSLKVYSETSIKSIDKMTDNVTELRKDVVALKVQVSSLSIKLDDHMRQKVYVKSVDRISLKTGGQYE